MERVPGKLLQPSTDEIIKGKGLGSGGFKIEVGIQWDGGVDEKWIKVATKQGLAEFVIIEKKWYQVYTPRNIHGVIVT